MRPYGHRQETEDAPTQHGRAPQAQEDGRGVSPCEEYSSIDQTCKEAAPPAWPVETSGGKGQRPTICRRRMKTWTASRASGRRGRGPQTLRRRSGHRGGAAVGCLVLSALSVSWKSQAIHERRTAQPHPVPPGYRGD